MTLDYNRVAELYKQYLSKNITEEQRLEFLTHVQNPDYTEFIKKLISESYEQPEILESLKPAVEDRIFRTIVDKDIISKPKLLRFWPSITVAATIAVIIFGTGLYYYTRNINQEASKQYADAITPGKIGATLTLSSGKKIKLDDAQNGELAREAGIIITKSRTGELIYKIQEGAGETNKINTLSTAKGETYKLQLPDGSYVWLNSASSLTYASKLIDGGKRIVKLQGEGYFEIAKDKNHPFVVITDKQNVEVLGTHFNINSYDDEDAITTTLLEGSVSVTAGKLKQLIKPGEQLVNTGYNFKINEVNTDNVIDWTNNDFNLDELDFKVAMRKIARWYNVDIFYEASVPNNMKTGGWISRNRKLSAILKHIESSGQAHFKVEGRKVHVSK